MKRIAITATVTLGAAFLVALYLMGQAYDEGLRIGAIGRD